jgi:hypothetical protein
MRTAVLQPFDPAEVIGVAEAPARSDRTQKQPPKHEFGREKRSLGNDPEKRSPRKAGSAPGGLK